MSFSGVTRRVVLVTSSKIENFKTTFYDVSQFIWYHIIFFKLTRVKKVYCKLFSHESDLSSLHP